MPKKLPNWVHGLVKPESGSIIEVSNTGLMEAVARSAKENGAMIMGVVPTKLEERGAVSDLLDVTFRAVNLSDRKDIMLQEADVLLRCLVEWERSMKYFMSWLPPQ